jgi:hypothetical protein
LLRFATGAPAGDGKVSEVGGEAKTAGERLAEGLGERGIVDVDPMAAAVADEVEVDFLASPEVASRTIGVVDVADDPELFEDLERSVDGGSVDHGQPGVNLPIDLLGRNLPGAHLDELQNYLALRRHAQAILP